MDTNLTPEQSLKVIESMIGQAKQSFQRMSFYFLLWGGLLLLATLGEYFAAAAGMAHGWLGWPVLGTLGGIIAGVHGSKEGRKQGASTFTDRMFLWLWSAFTVTLILLIVSLVSQGERPGPYVSLLTGLPTFVTGALLRFRPLMLGGVLFWVLGLVALFVWPEGGALLFGAALLFGYIVPGYMLKREEDGLRTA